MFSTERKSTDKLDRSYVLVFLYILLLIQDCLVAIGISIMGFCDEAFSIVFILVVLLYLIKNNFLLEMTRYEIILMQLYFCFVLIGIVSNIINSDQTILYVLLDILTSSKMFLAIVGAKIIFSNGISFNVKNHLRIVTKTYIVILFVFAIHDWFSVPFFKVGHDNAMMGFASKYLYLMYSNPTYLAAYAIAALIVLIYTAERKNIWTYIFMDAMVIILTTRSKAWGFLCLAFLIYWISNKASSTKSVWKRMVVIFPIAFATLLLVAMDKIIIYFFTPSHYSPRAILLNEGIALAKELFPLGSGFGTFCSVAAITTNKGTGLLPYNNTAYYDAFWACISGQFGILGIIIFVAMISVILCEIMSLLKYNRRAWYVAVLALSYLVITSLGETSFFSQYSVLFGIVIGGCCTCNRTGNLGVNNEKDFSFK